MWVISFYGAPRTELWEVGKGSTMAGYIAVLGLGSDHQGLSLRSTPCQPGELRKPTQFLPNQLPQL